MALHPHFNFTAQEIIEQGRVTRQQIDEFKTWLMTVNPEYPELCEEQIILFLLSCNCDLDATKATVKAHYTAKLSVTEFFDDRDMDREDLQLHLNAVDYAVMPTRTPTGAAVAYFRIKPSAFYIYHVNHASKVCFMTLDSILCDNPPTGVICVFDLEGVSLMHLTRLRLGALKNFFYYLQEGLPLKMQQVEVINTPYFVDKFMTIIKPFMKQELTKMIRFHGKNLDLKEFHKLIPSECLPVELGGNLGPLKSLVEKTIQKLRDLKPFFQAEQNQRYKK